MANNKTENIKKMLQEDPMFVNSPKYENNIYKVIESYPNGASESIICRLLCISPEEFTKLQNSAIMKLRKSLGEDKDGQNQVESGRSEEGY